MAQQPNKELHKIMTTLHAYPLEGPTSPGENQVWYCDNRVCKYTKHGVYAKYRIPLWRSTKFASGFVLCDGCAREYQQHSQPNQNLNINIALQQQPLPQQPLQQQPYQPPINQPVYQPPVNQPIYQPSVNQPVYQPPVNQPVYQPPVNQPVYQPPVNQPPYQPPVQLQPPQTSLNNNSLHRNSNLGIDNTKPHEKRQSFGGNTSKLLKQGFMMKKGNFIQNWKKRFFVLHSDRQFYYYESEQASSLKGTIQLTNVKCLKKIGNQSFEIVTPDRTWCLCCQNIDDRDDWCNIVATLCHKPIIG